MAEQDKGLPMAAKWDPEKLQQEIAQLDALSSQPLHSKVGGYVRRSGPGLLQSAMTLGAGSAAASVMAGASFGYKLLWVQPVAMLLGICMLAALGNVVLTTGERPYKAFGRELSVTLAFLWALGTVVASVIWHFPQYTLAAGAIRDLVSTLSNAQMDVAAAGTTSLTTIGLVVSILTGLAILSINIFTTWNYGSHSRGIKTYEWFLRGVIALVILSFGIVVVANITNINWAELLEGVFGFHGIPQVKEAPGLKPQNLDSLTLVLGMLGAAVGINMTFLYPYSLLAKGWGKHHKTLSRWDLAMSMFLPFVLVTSLVIIGMAVSGVYDPANEYVRIDISPLQASSSLAHLMGAQLGRVIFDLGLFGMTCGAISTHMVVCGFTVCEMFGLEYTVWRYRMFTLVPAIGILGVVFNINRVIWFPIVASAICFTMLPIAYVMFLILNNKRSYIGKAVGRGVGRVIFNAILVVALAVATVGSAIQLHKRVFKPIQQLFEKPTEQVLADPGNNQPAPAQPTTR
jgi:manganese transport protein